LCRGPWATQSACQLTEIAVLLPRYGVALNPTELHPKSHGFYQCCWRSNKASHAKYNSSSITFRAHCASSDTTVLHKSYYYYYYY